MIAARAKSCSCGYIIWLVFWKVLILILYFPHQASGNILIDFAPNRRLLLKNNYCHKLIDNLFHLDVDENKHKKNGVHYDFEERKAEAQNLVYILSQIAEKKKAPVSADTMPPHTLWESGEEFSKLVMERMVWIIKSDLKMGKQGAVKKAETYLEAVRDTHDRKMVQVYERLVYELKITSPNLYRQLKKYYG